MKGKVLTVINLGSLVEIFSNYGCYRHKKILFSNSVVQSSRSGSKQNTKRKPKVTYLTWVMVFLAAENENQQMEGLPPAVFMKIFLFSVRKKSITESIVKRKLCPLSVYVMVERIFSS